MRSLDELRQIRQRSVKCSATRWLAMWPQERDREGWCQIIALFALASTARIQGHKVVLRTQDGTLSREVTDGRMLDLLEMVASMHDGRDLWLCGGPGL